MERGILFSAPMVKALLAGTKIQTRRVITPQPGHLQLHRWHGKTIYNGDDRMWCWRDLVLENIWDFPSNSDRQELAARCLYGKPGDLLWVRETWTPVADEYGTELIAYRAGGYQIRGRRNGMDECFEATAGDYETDGWKPSLFMPKWASRIWLEITDVRVERVNQISEEDARAEGADPNYWADVRPDGEPQPGPSIAHRVGFHELWDSINAERGYDFNSGPWVWVISFRRIKNPVEIAA